MMLEVVDSVSLASGVDNEDRAGAEHTLAWVIDGATDVLPERLTPDRSDAVWFAKAMHAALSAIAAAPPSSLIDVPELVAATIAPRFLTEARRPPAHPGEQPSAAGIVIRAHTDGTLEFVSLGDCVLLAESGGTLARVGVDEEQTGDRWVADALRNSRGTGEPLTRSDLLPRLRDQRTMMNRPDGYGIFSITAPPRAMIRHGALPVSTGARVLLATDGLTRLIDVFRRYDTEGFWNAAWSRGLAALAAELRALEADDAACSRFPRAKTSDDATGLLLRVMDVA